MTYSQRTKMDGSATPSHPRFLNYFGAYEVFLHSFSALMIAESSATTALRDF